MENQSNNATNKFNLFQNIVVLTKKYGKKNMMFSLLIFIIFATMGFLAYLIKDIDVNKVFDRYNANQEIIHQEGIEKRQQADDLVPDILDAVRLRSKADRVMILEYHNGLKNSADLPFYHFTATYESIDLNNDTIYEVADQYKNQNTGSYASILKQIKKNGYIYSADITSEPKSRVLRKLDKNEIESYYICEIYDSAGVPSALLSIASNKTDGIDKDYIDKNIYKITAKIGRLLTGINDSHKK